MKHSHIPQVTAAEKKEFNEMTSSEKKHFLSMDLIERIIRVEQRVSAHFHKPVQYNETEYYKSLGKETQKKFEDYLRKKKRKKYLLGVVFILPLFLIFILRVGFTGYAINTTLGGKATSLLTWVLVIVLLLISIAVVLKLKVRQKRNKKYEEYYNILEKAIIKK